MTIGPVEVLVLTLPGTRVPDTVLAPIAGVVRAGHVRLLDAVSIARGADGSLTTRDLEDERPAALADLPVEPVVMLNEDDVEAIADDVPAGSTALVLAIEHVWSRGVAAAVRALDGELTLQVRIDADVAQAAFDAAQES